MKGWRSCCSGGDGLDGLAVCKLDFYEKAPLEEIKRRIFFILFTQPVHILPIR